METPERSAVFAGITLTTIDDPGSFYEEGRHQLVCAGCKKPRRPWEVHHVLSKQHCRLYGAPLYSPDDALRVCAKAPDSCHSRHTSHQELLTVSCLRDENIAFIAKHLGCAYAIQYLTRYYAGSDPRFDALLGGL